MDRSQEVSVFLFVIFIALISLSRSDSIVTAIEGEVAILQFPYSCGSDKITIHRANGALFYNSAEPEYLKLPDYLMNRFSVEEKNCSLRVEINPVMRDDEATYICQAYKDGIILGGFIRFRLYVDYPPGIVSCIPSGKDTVGDWVPLQCEASVGSLAGEIICYQDANRLPPYNELVQNGEIMEQSVWVTKEYPVFCCSSLLDQPQNMCDCNDFTWDPSGLEITTDPCPASTPRQHTTSKENSETQTIQNQKENNEDHPFTDNLTPLATKSYFIQWSWGYVIMFSISLVEFIAFAILLRFYHKSKKVNQHLAERLGGSTKACNHCTTTPFTSSDIDQNYTSPMLKRESVIHVFTKEE